MVVFPNAKINVGLHIVSKRADGYHNIETCFVPIPLKDILEIVEGDEQMHKGVQLTTSGLAIPGKPDDNLCIKAYELLKADFDLPPIKMHLHKIIPMGGGLGGGSSDASFALRTLNEQFDLNIDNRQLENYASQLGSDCPFFIRNQPVLATGTGNQFQDISLDLSGKHIALVFPDVSVSTAEAYAGVVPRENTSASISPLSDLIRNNKPEQWKNEVVNDFEVSVFHRYPTLKDIKDQLYEAGAFYASMSGSGSTVYGLFDRPPQIDDLASNYQVWQDEL